MQKDYRFWKQYCICFYLCNSQKSMEKAFIDIISIKPFVLLLTNFLPKNHCFLVFQMLMYDDEY